MSRRHQLRRQLAYYVARAGFEIGDYSFGAPVIRYFNDGNRLRIGKYCSIAAGSTFVLGGVHKTDAVTAFPVGVMQKDCGPEDMPISRGDIVLGSDVWVATNALILSGVTIGDGAVVGAGSVVIEDVPPYAIVFGNPARVISMRFSEEIVRELLELRWWDLSDSQVLALRSMLQGPDIEAFIDACRAMRGMPPRVAVLAAAAPQPSVAVAEADAICAPVAAGEAKAAVAIIAIIQRELPSFSAADLDKTFDVLGIDSFGMLMIRTHAEEELRIAINDREWSNVDKPADLVSIYGRLQTRLDPAGRNATNGTGAKAPAADRPLWTPDPKKAAATQVRAFMAEANRRHGLTLSDYRGLHAWSIAHRDLFWDLVWDVCGVIGNKGRRLAIDIDKMPGAKFFPDARLNFAENLLRRADAGEAIVFRADGGTSSRMSWLELSAAVSRMQQALQNAGVQSGDCVAALLPNVPEAVVLMLAVTSLGAVWCSCSPDFGAHGVLERFRQVNPKVLVSSDGYWLNGKPVGILDKLEVIASALPSARVVVLSYVGEANAAAAHLPGAVTLESFLQPFKPRPLHFERLPFAHPAFIVFSSGTTGMPKCIVHGAGGTLLQHLKEHRLQCDVRPGDRVFYYTTCGWMMWNWLVSALASEATLVLYDGAPFAPNASNLWNYAEQERVTLFGTSAKYIEGCRQAGIAPMQMNDLSALKLIASTGSPLTSENFDYVYRSIKSDVHLASISGGTDILSCFVIADPTSPVWAGEIQAAGLGMAVEVWSDDGKPLASRKGELVCTRPFVSMPVGFWNDPDGKQYGSAYFERFPGVWHQGDFAEWTRHGGMVIHGRSDSTLNPGGVRFGTAEIYGAIGSIPEIQDAVCIGQDWNGDVRVVLFVRLKDGTTLDDRLKGRINSAIRNEASPSHVPAKIIQIADVPRTRSGKLSEIAVRETVHDRPIKNTEALANPEALACYRGIAELRQ